MIIFFISLLPLIVFPEYKLLPVTGEYEVATLTKYLVDDNREETYSNGKKPRALAVEF